jgi:sugar lactone lactonase YvrE
VIAWLERALSQVVMDRQGGCLVPKVYRYVSIVAAFALSACGASTQSLTPVASLQSNDTSNIVSTSASSTGDVYVANIVANNVTAYAPGKTSILRTLSVGEPQVLALDHSGNLYVASDSKNSISVYSPGGLSLLRTITKGVSVADALVFDNEDNLYVANCTKQCDSKKKHGTVTVYKAGTATLTRTITDGVDRPEALAFDSTGNLYVCNAPVGTEGGPAPAGSVTVYASGKGTPLRTITSGVVGPSALAIDKSNELYVANTAGANVTVYAAGKTSVLRMFGKFSSNEFVPVRLAFNGSGNLYVVDDGGNGSVDVFAPKGTSPVQVITQGLNAPSSIAFDKQGKLYVSSWPFSSTGSTVTAYAPGKTSVLQTITAGITSPVAIAVAP